MLPRSWWGLLTVTADGMMSTDMSVRTARLLAVLLGVTLVGLLGAPMAGAQTGPYGSTTTTAPVGEVEASCTLSLTEGKPGTEVTATVAGVFYGERVRVLFDGLQVAETTAPEAPSAASTNLPTTGAVVAQTAGAPVVFNAVDDEFTTSVVMKFVVPNAAPGTHIVTAVGDTFTCFCNPKGEFEVLAAGSGRGSLAKTGVGVLLLLVVAAALVLVGRTFLGASRRSGGARADAGSADVDRTFTSAGR